MNAMPQLNDAEVKYFESGGEDVAPSLREEAPAVETGGEESPAANDTGDEASNTLPEAKSDKESRFVPLQALQEERAEKKQLREELRQFREWQAQLTQRLQQMPQGQPSQQPQMPDPQTRPLDYINYVLGSVQNSTAELQQWRQQQELASQQRATVQQYADWARGQELEFSKAQPEYRDAYRFAAESRDKELQALGYTDPGVRASIVRMNTAEITHNAATQGRNPAELVWEYARARGFTPKSARNGEAQAKIAAGLQTAGGKLNRGGETGEGDMSARDLAGISDPDEFEKAWKRVFGRKR